MAPHADAGITAYHAVKKLLPRLEPGSTVAMIGIGGVGHIALQLVDVLGASHVIAIDTDERRRQLARELGANEVLGDEADTVGAVRDLTGGRGVDVVFDFVGTDGTHEGGLAMLARRGVYSVIGYGGTISLPSVGDDRDGDVDRRQSRRQLDRPLGAPPAPRAGSNHAALGDVPARAGERRARRARATGDITGRAVLVP